MKKKKGFTLVELLVVIAILAVLATVSVVGYMGFTKKAHESNDASLTAQMNTALQANGVVKKNKTLTEAREDLLEAGIDLEKVTPTTDGYSYVWDSKQDLMFLLNENREVVAPTNATISANTVDSFVVVHNETEFNTWKSDYSLYFANGYESKQLILDKLVGIDAGTSGINNISVKDDSSTADVTMYTTSGTLTIDARQATVRHYGEAKTVSIIAIAGESYHEYGIVTGNIEVENGHLAVENTANVSTIIAKPTESTTVKVTATNENNVGTIVTTDTSKTTFNVPESVKPTENITDDKLNEMNDFDGGYGTEKSPYLISTTNQLLKIENNKSYSLVEDIDLSSTNPMVSGSYDSEHISNFKNGTLNGNGHSITLAKGASFINHAEYSKFNDLSFIFNYKNNVDQTIVKYSSNLNMTNVYTYGSASMTGNVGIFCLYLGHGEINSTYANFTNCINYANITGASYNALFVGYTFVENNTTLNFDNCKNAGNFVSTEGAFYLANCAGNGDAQKTSVTININNSGNLENGIFRVTNVNRKFNPYIYSFQQGTKVLVKDNGETKVDVTDLDKITSYLPFNCFVGPNDTNLKLLLNDDNTFTINKSSFENVTKYVVRVGLYSQIVKYNVGTQIVYVTETIKNNKNDTIKTTLKNLSFTETKGKEMGTIGDGAIIVEVNGIEYYYFNVENCGLKNGTQKATIFEVLAYDENDALVSSYKTFF